MKQVTATKSLEKLGGCENGQGVGVKSQVEVHWQVTVQVSGVWQDRIQVRNPIRKPVSFGAVHLTPTASTQLRLSGLNPERLSPGAVHIPHLGQTALDLSDGYSLYVSNHRILCKVSPDDFSLQGPPHLLNFNLSCDITA